VLRPPPWLPWTAALTAGLFLKAACGIRWTLEVMAGLLAVAAAAGLEADPEDSGGGPPPFLFRKLHLPPSLRANDSCEGCRLGLLTGELLSPEPPEPECCMAALPWLIAELDWRKAKALLDRELVSCCCCCFNCNWWWLLLLASKSEQVSSEKLSSNNSPPWLRAL